MKVFRVITSFSMLVLAETPEEACAVARINQDEAECEQDEAIRVADEVTTLRELSSDERGSIPWGGPRTCEKILLELLPS